MVIHGRNLQESFNQTPRDTCTHTGCIIPKLRKYEFCDAHSIKLVTRLDQPGHYDRILVREYIAHNPNKSVNVDQIDREDILQQIGHDVRNNLAHKDASQAIRYFLRLRDCARQWGIDDLKNIEGIYDFLGIQTPEEIRSTMLKYGRDLNPEEYAEVKEITSTCNCATASATATA